VDLQEPAAGLGLALLVPALAHVLDLVDRLGLAQAQQAD
jgi:hypothetical protein